MENSVPENLTHKSNKQLLNLYKNRVLLNTEIQISIETEIKNRGGIDTLKSLQNRKTYVSVILLLVIFTSLALPFHYVPSRMKIFPKEHLSFNHTLITEDDIEKVIDRYNNASFFEKTAINNEPFVRTLMEQGLIEEKKNNNQSQDNN